MCSRNGRTYYFFFGMYARLPLYKIMFPFVLGHLNKEHSFPEVFFIVILFETLRF